MLWSYKWRSVPLLSGTFLFAMVRPYLNHKHFWVDVLEDIRVHISLSSLQNRAGGKVEDVSVQTALVIPTWKRLLTWVTRKPQSPVDIEEFPETLM